MFGVFDGHGGREVAIYCNLNYQKILKNSANLIKENGEQEWLRRSFLAVDDELRTVKGYNQLGDLRREKPPKKPALLSILSDDKDKKEEE